MTKKFFKVITICALVFSSLFLSAQTSHKVKRGYVVVDSTKYPVYNNVQEVSSTPFGGIEYDIKASSSKKAESLSKRVQRFYRGKKIGSVIIPKFKVNTKSSAKAWYSVIANTKKGKGVICVIQINDKIIRVSLFDYYSEEVLGQLLDTQEYGSGRK